MSDASGHGSPPEAALRALEGVGLTDDEVELGEISGVFGVEGEVRVHLHHRESLLLRRTRKLVFVDPQGRRFLGSFRVRPGAGKRILGCLEGLTTPEDAAALKGWRFAILRRYLPPLEDDEFYWTDVLGAPVFIDGEVQGRVERVDTVPGMDVLVIQRRDGEQAWVPCRKELVVKIDPKAREVHLVPGALDDGSEG